VKFFKKSIVRKALLLFNQPGKAMENWYSEFTIFSLRQSNPFGLEEVSKKTQNQAQWLLAKPQTYRLI
jgi:hypothetical protein